MRLLLLEDDQQLGKALQTALSQEEFPTVWVRRVLDAKRLIEAETFAVILLDIVLPDGSGLDILRWVRESGKTVPVLMLTARDSISDRIEGLDLGADDYLPKPFAIPELLSRIRAVNRRSAGFASAIWRVGALSVEPARRRAQIGDLILDLSPKEYDLLLELVRSAGKYVTRSQLEGALFRVDNQPDSNSLEVHIHNLRKKLGELQIKTIRGVGYLLEQTS